MVYPYLEWVNEYQEKRRLDLIDRIFIGRSCRGIAESRRIIVDHPAVSRDHAEICLTGSQLLIKDASKNGTWVNGVRLTPGSTDYLSDGDVIRLGDTLIYVKYPSPAPRSEDDESFSTQTAIGPKEVIVTNLVADVRGFTRMTEEGESRHIYAMMKDIIETFCVIVREYSGVIKDFPGDAVYAFWEHGPVESREQAVLACRAALKQKQSANRIRAKLRDIHSTVTSLRLGWGIATGRVTMSHYGVRVTDLALVGDSTNVAFRLSSVANKELPNEILICSSSANLVRDTLYVNDLGLISLQGRSRRERVFGIT